MVKRARVLLVDDDPALLQALSDALQLRMRGLVIDTGESARIALDRLSQTEYDAVVADIKMPGMDGIELLRRIRELRPDTPTLLITGHGEHDLAIQALRNGAHDYVQKPIDREYFVRSLTHAIERRQLSRKVASHKEQLEKQSQELERCLEERTLELRELYQREALARAELERTTAELESAQRRRDELASIIAHELASPLTTLRGYAQVLARPSVSPDVRERAKNILVSETSRMERLIQDLVDDSDAQSRSLALRIERCDLAAVAREQLEAASARSKRHNIVLEAPDQLEAECDAARVAQVFANLLANAVTYTPRGEIRMELWQEGHNARVSISDQGPGIPTESLDTIFAPRVRLDPRPARGHLNGKGLGLSIARDIVEAHGGRIWADNNPEKGARFNLVLPLSGPRGGPQSGRDAGVRANKKLVAKATAGHKARARRAGR